MSIKPTSPAAPDSPTRDAAGPEHGDERLRRAESRLERSISLLQAALDSTADGILIVDRTGRVVRTNRRFAEIWDIPPEILASDDDDRLLDEATALLDRAWEVP